MPFGLFFLTASNWNSSLVHTLQLQLSLTRSNNHSCLQKSLSCCNRTFKDVVGRCACAVFQLRNVLRRHDEHFFVSTISKLIHQCETTNEVHKNYREDENDKRNPK